jgi:glycosyltransferase involved in cell wall biosynthesis
MKIVHVSHLYHPSEGGVQFWFKNVSERLVKHYGDDVTLVTTDSFYGPERTLYKKVEPAQETINGVKVIRFPYQRWHLKGYYLFFKVLAKCKLPFPEKMLLRAYGPYSPAMNRYLKRVNADAICAGSAVYYYMQLPLWKKCNFFYFGSIHLTDNTKSKTLTNIQYRSIMASTLYFANTTYEKNKLVKAGIPHEKIMVLGVGVDADAFNAEPCKVAEFKKELDIPEDAVTIAYAGRIEKTKNILTLIRSFEKLATENKNVYLLIAGSGKEYVEHLQQFSNTFSEDISARIKWKANFELAEKAALFHSIDILVLPSNNESFGIVFLEAWICKKPVVGSSIGAVKDVINEGVDGLLMKINDIDSLTQQLKMLANSPALRKQLGENGYRKVIENYTWDIITKRLRQCYTNGLLQNQNKTNSECLEKNHSG